MSFTVKSNKRFGRFIPSERKKIAIMQVIIDSQAKEVEQKVNSMWRDHLLYGLPLPEFKKGKVTPIPVKQYGLATGKVVIVRVV